MLAFVRLSTSPRVFPSPLSPAQAMSRVQEWLEAPAAVVVHPTERHAAILDRLLTASGSAGNLTNDTHLAALAVGASAWQLTVLGADPPPAAVQAFFDAVQVR